MDIYQSPASPLTDPSPRHRLLEDIAHELSGEVVFPTSFDTVTRLHGALEDPDMALGDLGKLIAVDPLVSARVLALANSAAYNPGGDTIQHLQKAIERLGIHNVRMVALAVATQQLVLARDAAPFRVLGDRLWAQSLHTAAAAWVLARRLTRVLPDEALLAGLIHNIGAFYMIYRGGQYADLAAAPEAMLQLLADWHESIGHTLVIALGLPQPLADAMLDQDAPRDWPDPVHSLADVVYVANQHAGAAAVWLQQAPVWTEAQAARRQELGDRFGDEIDAHHQALKASLA